MPQLRAIRYATLRRNIIRPLTNAIEPLETRTMLAFVPKMFFANLIFPALCSTARCLLTVPLRVGWVDWDIIFQTHNALETERNVNTCQNAKRHPAHHGGQVRRSGIFTDAFAGQPPKIYPRNQDEFKDI